MNSITITRLYDQLTSKLGKETAENLISFIEQKVGEAIENNEKGLFGEREILKLFDKPKPARKKSFWLEIEGIAFIIVILEVIGIMLLYLFALKR